jgi:hypothetical protein
MSRKSALNSHISQETLLQHQYNTSKVFLPTHHTYNTGHQQTSINHTIQPPKMGGSTSKPFLSPRLFSRYSTAPCSARNITWQYIHSAGHLPPAYAECANTKDVLDVWQCSEGECKPEAGLLELVFRSEFEYYSWPWNTWDGLGDSMVGRLEGNQTAGIGGQLVKRGGWVGAEAGAGTGAGGWNGTARVRPTSVDGSAVARIKYHGANGGNRTSSITTPATSPVQWNQVGVGAGIIVLLVLALAFVLWFNCKGGKSRTKNNIKSMEAAEEKKALVRDVDFDIENLEGFEVIALDESDGRGM